MRESLVKTHRHTKTFLVGTVAPTLIGGTFHVAWYRASADKRRQHLVPKGSLFVIRPLHKAGLQKLAPACYLLLHSADWRSYNRERELEHLHTKQPTVTHLVKALPVFHMTEKVLVSVHNRSTTPPPLSSSFEYSKILQNHFSKIHFNNLIQYTLMSPK